MYRAKVKSSDPVISKRWAYGDKATVEGRTFIIPDDATIAQWGKNYGIFGFIEVIPESVGQSTGLKDKAGVEIFGGDVVECVREDSFPDYNVGEIGYDTNRACFLVRYFKKIQQKGFLKTLAKDGQIISDTTNTYMYEKVTAWKFTVIGNTTDNPELLQETDR